MNLCALLVFTGLFCGGLALASFLAALLSNALMVEFQDESERQQ